MTDVSDVGMPRSGRGPPRRSVYWWSPELGELRTTCNHARRRYTDARRESGGGPETEATAQLGETYRTTREELAKAIGVAKHKAWTEFLVTLDTDPWGRPYAMVRKQFRPWAPPLTETLDPHFLEVVINALFPVIPERAGRPPGGVEDRIEWSEEEMGVTEEELDRAVKRLGLKDTAPGPDGIHGRVWCLAYSAIGPRLRRLFNACLSQGNFPQIWKEASLVLLRKAGRPEDQPSAYRPICLLDEVGKLFERVIAQRLVEHLSQQGPDLAECQYGFREGRSTVDAINRVRSVAEGVVSHGGVALAISFDIKNAFNTLPWDRIKEALRVHEVPPYLRRIIGEYLRDRWVKCPGKDGTLHRRRVYCGVPQGSVLGPILWNLGYNTVLETRRLHGVSVVCYADDTLLIATGADWVRAHARAEIGARHLVERIRALGLQVDLAKTEALWFHAPRRQVPRLMTQIRLGGETTIVTGTQMKYLGLFLDGTWCFRSHFGNLAPRIKGATLAFGRLLPNIEGPGGLPRRLYTGVVRSMALYGSPVWARDLRASPQNRRTLLQMGRHIAQRVARAYRTVSAEVAYLLAGVPPWDLLAEMYGENYHRAKELRGGVRRGTSRVRDTAVRRLKHQAWQLMRLRWQRRLADSDRHDIVRAIQPLFDKWLDGENSLTFHMTQMLTGHGCFSAYLHRIKRESDASCKACNGGAPDTEFHTLQECPAFAGERRVLRGVVGWDLSLPGIVKAILDSDENWKAFDTFCEKVLTKKEEAERKREHDEGDQTHGPPRPRRGRRNRGPAPLSDSSSSGSSSDGLAAATPGAARNGGAGIMPPPRRRAPRRACRGPQTAGDPGGTATPPR